MGLLRRAALSGRVLRAADILDTPVGADDSIWAQTAPATRLYGVQKSFEDARRSMASTTYRVGDSHGNRCIQVARAGESTISSYTSVKKCKDLIRPTARLVWGAACRGRQLLNIAEMSSGEDGEPQTAGSASLTMVRPNILPSHRHQNSNAGGQLVASALYN